MREIGSEFWTLCRSVYTKNTTSEVYLLSGRTALHFIIEDIVKTRMPRKVLLPSYCCESIILPFVQTGIDIQFYQVNFDGIDYPYDNDADVVFLIDYFGYEILKNGEIARAERQAGKVILYDATHKINGNPQVQAYADYSFCSYRKWFYCNYAKAIKHTGDFCQDNRLISNERYIAIRDEAAFEKEKYFAGLTGGKEGFLAMFSTAEQMLDEDYIGYAGIAVDFDLREISKKRRENAAYLISELKNFSQIKLWRDNIMSDDVPLFVPIMVSPLLRNDLRSALIKENIYCPIHWAKSPLHGKCNDLYDTELSLICDQRYDIKDMERMFRVIKDYFNR